MAKINFEKSLAFTVLKAKPYYEKYKLGDQIPENKKVGDSNGNVKGIMYTGEAEINGKKCFVTGFGLKEPTLNHDGENYYGMTINIYEYLP